MENRGPGRSLCGKVAGQQGAEPASASLLWTYANPGSSLAPPAQVQNLLSQNFPSVGVPAELQDRPPPVWLHCLSLK